ncbi:hypothetical protein ASF61_05440 [Duganella sp. Leaf126]|uniref:hypothetical protein n=1 Tax=Duganella sp. Leaf126 TaxID=1736266 RepID=UPI0006F3B3D6|nr:hypothetical protein [Duganella sp. Leaf126]KQQ40524.1 hypothetical protein ASF61_05440 [Duganella sp. Leaf126]
MPPAEQAQQQRSDHRSSAIVERGIAVQSTFNTVCAIEYLRSHNVQSHIIERVLSYPDQRRQHAH